jgi:hypothetical protein
MNVVGDLCFSLTALPLGTGPVRDASARQGCWAQMALGEMLQLPACAHCSSAGDIWLLQCIAGACNRGLS